MNRQHQLLIPLLLAVAGYAALAFLAPRTNPLAGWNYRLEREGAAERAREAAARFYGFDTSGWTPRFKAEIQEQTAFYLTRPRQQASSAYLSPVKTSVLLIEPGDGRRRVTVELNTEGLPKAFLYQDSSAPDSPPQEGSGVAPEAARKTAEAALTRLVGDEAGLFTMVSEGAPEKEGARFVWERVLPGEPDLKLRAETLVRGETVKEASVRSIFTPRFTQEFTALLSPVTMLDALNVFLASLVILSALIFLAVAAIRREIRYRTALVLLGVLFLLAAPHNFFGGEFDSSVVESDFKIKVGGTPVGALLSLLLPTFFWSLGLALLWGLGLTLARRADPSRYASFAALLKGKLLSSFVSGRVAAGFLLGGVLALVPYLLAVSGLFDIVKPELPDAQLLVAPAPALATLLRPLPYVLFTVYGFLLPLFGAFIRKPRVTHALGLLFGWLWLGETILYRPSVPVALAAGALLVLIADQIYWRYDFLTLLAAALAADITTTALFLLEQPAAGLSASGWRALSMLGALLLVSLVVSWKGRATQAEDESDVAASRANTAQEKAERERLVAEFSVARHAQQRMLPSAPPTVPGFSIAATCRPAREVGGDLYDFLTLPDERIGIVVADVSGKGVPAALYMTLTKGLLASVAGSESDPSVILCEVNRHLYQVCQRKVFVTMILGVLDPATRTVTYARAGHNHGIWRRGPDGVLKLLRAPGIGLGMVSGQMFDRSLKREAIELEPGDVLLFYSDGITEAMNLLGEEFGTERLLAAVGRANGLSAEEIRSAILDEVGAFLGETPPQDDITLVVISVGER